jgi:hypothetical protein
MFLALQRHFFEKHRVVLVLALSSLYFSPCPTGKSGFVVA